MKIVVFGLTVSSSWGNGHATLWRGLCRALGALGHRVVFFEKDVPYYAQTRDLLAVPGAELVLYPEWGAVRDRATAEIADADAGMTTSYCPDGAAAAELLFESGRTFPVFYDLDTPVTLARLAEGGSLPYLPARGLRDFGLVLSYTGGPALAALRDRLGARQVAPLYGHADPEVYRPGLPVDRYRADLSYLGTYAADRQRRLEELFVAPAARRPRQRFLIGGAQYPTDFPWTPNICFVRHLPPDEHAPFYASSRLTLNVTRRDMAAMGWCPSGRLFEAAACGAAILSDQWPGLEQFFMPGREILTAATTGDVLAALDRDDAELSRIAAAGRERLLAEHTSHHRAAELVTLIAAAMSHQRAEA